MKKHNVDVLSDLVIYTKYAKYQRDLKRRETWNEIVDRYIEMMVSKYCSKVEQTLWKKHKRALLNDPKLISNGGSLFKRIIQYSEFLYSKKVLMSMRAAQFSGQAIRRNESRIYNCAYLPIDHYKSFAEIMFLLLGGTGVGFSVQKHHVEKLPPINKPTRHQKFLIADSIEGWADSILALMKAYFGKRDTLPRFDYSDIRPKGTVLKTAGGKAPGPAPLRICHAKIESILSNVPTGSKLSPLQVHDIVCHIADAVLAGGIRRAALISLFSFDDREMATCKHGMWWELNPQRGRANNSAVIIRNRIKQEEFFEYWKLIEDSGSGEPGILWTNDVRYGTNPCGEISLREFQFCNLTEINGGSLLENRTLEEAKKEFLNRCLAASFFGTLQAGFTDLHYLRPIWKRNTEKDHLIGVGITGICNGDLMELLNSDSSILSIGAEYVRKINKETAEEIGIKEAARCTTIKPSGTTSLVLGTSSGIHPWYSKYYIRNIQCAVGDELYTYFSRNHPNLIKIMDYDPNSAVIGIPIKSPDGAIIREDDDVFTMLNRIKKFNESWVRVGHRSGPNYNNVSATIYIKDDEWTAVGKWVWENKDYYNGLSFLPFDNGTYRDAPFQECDLNTYLEKSKLIEDVDLTKIYEDEDNTTLIQELACQGGACDLEY